MNDDLPTIKDATRAITGINAQFARKRSVQLSMEFDSMDKDDPDFRKAGAVAIRVTRWGMNMGAISWDMGDMRLRSIMGRMGV